ncbi:WD40 repeat domain-containing protein [Aspergillus glaucus CBS 516.65]|uniref:Gem-associated protein 5 TPR domain-containing protein n=1 Tax=Aspergillus glaucus CBS 516.65 TaxID=1160497 RepID=A0A1L9V994_ASPGL|nr:hypothetical protein ASPGLDRAFT_134886 [Aspergillus glaucus CBS 516.65]OJJ80412.1 hypothetical protein ASPGLDRAFT_134886 [Aspergillus glaucus CBS 516.65]
MVQLTRNRSQSLITRPMAPPPQAPERSLEACASTASLFLYAQGSSILCLHHDTLALDRRFENHQEDIAFISVDNVSERGQGRLVVSYDVGQTAIVWDLFTGTEIARFAAFEPLKVASWMRNGNVAFGNTKGEVILFEPSTSEHVLTGTISEPITTLAPGADCRTYAIGYQNGTTLLATLHPTFNILHTLTISRNPSPLVNLSWHASSSKQKSDMLASQALNGDLKVWSVSKPAEKEPPRTIRVLKRSDTAASGPQWMAWSKNGKILQYMNGEAWSWDVRTKHVTSERIPAINGVRGIANYGPTATLFTLGPNFAVQQYDLEISTMVANVHHPPMSSGDAQLLPSRSLQDSPEIKESPYPFDGRRTPSDNEQPHADLASPASSRSNASSKASGRYRMPLASPPSRSEQSNTPASTLPSSSERNTPQPSHGYAPSMSTLSTKSSRAGSRLRNEVQFSPADKQIDLFPFLRTRLNDVPYGHHQPLDETNLTPDGLRQRMLSMVFGWEGDVQGLIQDELNRHPPGSQSSILLAQWLGALDTDEMISMIYSGPVSISDWMIMAFSQMSGQAQANKVGQAFVQKLLETGDIHTAATILLGLGDKNDAIEVYVSQNYFLEAILMTCLLMPTDWQRQSYLVRRWGEHVVSHSQQQLAIRCYMCTGAEPSEPWTSPAAQNAATFAEGQRSPMASPGPAHPVSPPSQRKQAATQKAIAKTPALKLITSFENPKMRLPGLKSDNQTPTNVPWITPIAESAVGESALSPGGLASWRANNMQSLNQAVGSRSNTPGFRGRLPSIGETPVDVEPPTFPPTPFRRGEYSTTSDSEDQQQDQGKEQEEEPSLLLPSARYDPNQETKSTPQTAIPASSEKFANIKGLPSPAPGVFEALHSESRNGSRDRKPDGLQISLFQDQLERMSNSRSPLSSSNSLQTAKTPSTGGYSIDQFIHSLDEANQFSNLQQHVDGQSTTPGWNEDPYNQLPLSPPPMSPEEATQEERYRAKHSRSQSRNESKVGKPNSRNSSRRRHNRSTSRNAAGRTSDRNDRGRSSERDGSGAMSPSSSLPMSPIDDALRIVTSDRERRTHQRSNSRRGEQIPGRRRDQSAEPVRPGSRQTREHEPATDEEFSTSNANGMSQEEQGLGNTDTSEQETRELPFVVGISEQRRKELAAAELEARRLSLARNPSAPNIPFPGDIRLNTRSPPVGLPFSISPFGQRSQARQRAPSIMESQSKRSSSDSGSSQPGLPTSPSSSSSLRQAKYNNGTSNGQEDNAADAPILLSAATYQPEEERIGRSMSVPMPETHHSPPVNANMPPNIPMHPRYNPNLPRSRSTSRSRHIGHRRENSREHGSPGSYFGGSPVAVSIEETLANADHQPPILPELQHLNTPPPPPPLPFSNSASASLRESSGTIDIAFDNENLGRLLPRAMTAGPAFTNTMDVRTSVNGSASASPDRRRMSFDHRRGKSANESFTSKIRNFTRMRSNSRGLEGWGSPAVETELPYESVQMVDRI